jgi:hypothetical protein
VRGPRYRQQQRFDRTKVRPLALANRRVNLLARALVKKFAQEYLLGSLNLRVLQGWHRPQRRYDPGESFTPKPAPGRQVGNASDAPSYGEQPEPTADYFGNFGVEGLRYPHEVLELKNGRHGEGAQQRNKEGRSLAHLGTAGHARSTIRQAGDDPKVIPTSFAEFLSKSAFCHLITQL